jgi:hypothetical protein
VLYGPDPFAGIVVPRAAEIFRLKQVLLNLTLRLREAYGERTGREERVAMLVAESSGPLRTCAATLLELETGASRSPKEALEDFVRPFERPAWQRALDHISEARERRVVEAGAPADAVFAMLEIAEALRQRAKALQ